MAAAVVAVAAGCGGQGGEAVAGAGERGGPDAACGECKVTGGGRVHLDGRPLRFSFQAIPVPGAAAGGGAAAKGSLRFVDPGGDAVDVPVDAILGCRREEGRLFATFAGTSGEDRIEVTVMDGGEPAQDEIAFHAPFALEPAPVVAGNVQVHALDRCAPEGGREGASPGGAGGTPEPGAAPGDPFVPL